MLNNAIIAIRVRIRKTALRPVVRVTPNVQQLHDVSPFLHPLHGCRKSYRTELGCLYFCASANPIIRRFQLCSFNLAFYIIFINSLFLYSSLADVQPTLSVVSHRHELRTAHDYRVSVESQASAEVRPRERETVVRGRKRKTAERPVARVTPNEQQLATCRSP